MNRFEWGEKLIIPLDPNTFEIEIETVQKGGVFRASASLGDGSINLLDPTQTKSILGSKDKKTAILYYKL